MSHSVQKSTRFTYTDVRMSQGRNYQRRQEQDNPAKGRLHVVSLCPLSFKGKSDLGAKNRRLRLD